MTWVIESWTVFRISRTYMTLNALILVGAFPSLMVIREAKDVRPIRER